MGGMSARRRGRQRRLTGARPRHTCMLCMRGVLYPADNSAITERQE